jgi:hypothetical protein
MSCVTPPANQQRALASTQNFPFCTPHGQSNESQLSAPNGGYACNATSGSATCSLCPGQRRDPVPMTSHGLPPAPGAAAAVGPGKTFTMEAERRLKECQERPGPFTERVDGYRGKS